MKISNILIIFLVLAMFCSCGEHLPMTDLFLAEIDTDGNNYQRLFDDIEGLPKYSRNGDRIIVAAPRAFWRCNSDGSDMVCILDSLYADDYDFSLSVIDETFIFVFVHDIYKFNYITKDIVNLVPNVEGYVKDANYSPDGLSIIFSTYYVEHPNNINHNFIYKMNNNGLNVELIYQDDPSQGRIENPMYTTDMSKIVFMKRNSGLYIMNSDGTNIQQFADDMVNTIFSTGGDFVVFLSNSIIKVYNIITNEIYNLAEGNCPQISNDGSKVLYRNYDYDNDTHFNIINIDGSNRKGLNDVRYCFFSFSFDSEKIIFIKEHKYYID